VTRKALFLAAHLGEARAREARDVISAKLDDPRGIA
jgi:hypothetical protein